MKNLFITLIGVSLSFSSILFAADDDSEVEEVVVVGSQIKGAKITGSLPVSVVTGIDIIKEQIRIAFYGETSLKV